jgi:hypothetical protein
MKKAILMVLLAALLATPLTGCDTADSDDEPAKTTTESKENGDNIPDYNAADANPASDFEYKVGEDGGITITKYVGTDTDVVIPEKIDGKNVTVIGEGAFRNCQVLKSIAMPDSIMIIDISAFESCASLTTVVLPNHLDQIQDKAFGNCKVLSHITFPDSLTHIGASAFYLCESLKSISIPANCFKSVDGNGFLFKESQNAFAKSGLETVRIAEGVEILQTGLFRGTKVSEIVIPSTVKVIEGEAFADCANLKNIVLNEGVKKIYYSFISNTSVKEIIIPQSVERLDATAFKGAESLEKVYFEGDMPEGFNIQENHGETKTFTIYYHEGATGFTSSEWNGYQTEIW